MATVEVSTWAELVSAISNVPTTEDTIIKITADIDLNDTNPEGVTNSFNSGWFTRTLVIDGSYTDSVTGETKNHVIKNLRTPISGTGSIFYFYYGSDTSSAIGVKFKGIDFQNFILSSGHGFDYDDTHLHTFVLTLENCRFVGSRGNYYLIGKNHYTSSQHNCSNILNNCYVDMPWSGAGQTNLAYTSLIPKDDGNATSAVATYCRFKETYGGWTWGDSLTYQSTDRFFSCSYFKMSGCRVEGSTQICGVTDSNDKGAYYMPIISKPNASYVPTTQNVFDVEITAVRNSATYDTDNVLYSTFTGVVNKNVKYNGTDVTTFTDNRSGFDGGTTTAPIFATPTQMKDPSYLLSQGFNIIVPAT